MFATIGGTNRIFAMQLVHTTFALRYIYEQRFLCDCLVHAAPNRPKCESILSATDVV